MGYRHQHRNTRGGAIVYEINTELEKISRYFFYRGLAEGVSSLFPDETVENQRFRISGSNDQPLNQASSSRTRWASVSSENGLERNAALPSGSPPKPPSA